MRPRPGPRGPSPRPARVGPAGRRATHRAEALAHHVPALPEPQVPGSGRAHACGWPRARLPAMPGLPQDPAPERARRPARPPAGGSGVGSGTSSASRSGMRSWWPCSTSRRSSRNGRPSCGRRSGSGWQSERSEEGWNHESTGVPLRRDPRPLRHAARRRGANGGQDGACRAGSLSAPTRGNRPAFFDAFREGLRERGWIDGRNLVIEARWGNRDQARDQAAELVQWKPDVLVTQGPMAFGARAVTRPDSGGHVGFSGDPVEGKLVASLARPGGSLTGISLHAVRS